MVLTTELSERDGLMAVLMAVAIVLPLYAALVIFRKRTDPHIEESNDCESPSFDSAPLTQRIQGLREDFASTLHVRRHPRPHAEATVTAAREMVASLPYFQDKRAAMAAEQNSSE